MKIDGSVAVVTGGASGLGRATAARLAAAGAKVVLLDLPSAPGAQAVEQIGPNATFAPADVTSEADVTAALDTAAALGPIRVAVNCAGIGTPGRVISGKGAVMPLAQFAQVVTVNLVGTFNVIRLAAAALAKNEPDATGERGVLVATASVAAFEGQIGQAAYAASKAGVAGLVLPAARELASLGIRVMAIAPGIFDTPMMASLPEKVRGSLAAQIPFPSRFGQPDEFAALVEHIITNPMLNGSVIRLDGALRMGPS